MNKLKGREILVGKDPSKEKLMVSLVINGKPQTAQIDQTNNVPNSISRCMPTTATGHCKICIDKESNMVLVNLKPANVTYVNGGEINSKKITTESRIQLGKDKYALDLGMVLDTAKRIIEKVEPQEYSIKHLEKVWDDYRDDLMNIKLTQRRAGLLKSITPMFTLGAGTIATFSKQMALPAYVSIISLILFVIGLILTVYGFFITSKDKSIEETEKIRERFQDEYVCPNSDCHHFMGEKPYKILSQDKKCPFCGSLFIK